MYYIKQTTINIEQEPFYIIMPDIQLYASIIILIMHKWNITNRCRSHAVDINVYCVFLWF